MRAISLRDRFADATGWLALAVIALVIVAWVLWSGIHPGFSTHDAAFCKASYSKARSSQDTLMVDAQQSLERNSSALSCGTLRKAGELR
jgi:hypothetical protein